MSGETSAADRAAELLRDMAACQHELAQKTRSVWCVRCGAYRMPEEAKPTWIVPTLAARAVALSLELEAERRNNGRP